VILERGHVLARGSVNEVIAHHAVGIVELEFAGRAPEMGRLFPGNTVTTSGSSVRIETNDPEKTTTAVLANLDARASGLRGLRVLQPSLESAFLQLTDDPSTSDREVVDVA
jgi:ABC-2 type transport system ATP-binding protein